MITNSSKFHFGDNHQCSAWVHQLTKNKGNTATINILTITIVVLGITFFRSNNVYVNLFFQTMISSKNIVNDSKLCIKIVYRVFLLAFQLIFCSTLKTSNFLPWVVSSKKVYVIFTFEPANMHEHNCVSTATAYKNDKHV